MIDEGHIVGNHTVNHPSMPDLTNDKLKEEITKLHMAVFEKFNYEMKYLRPPKGEFSQRTLELTKSLGYTTVMWSFAYDDWDENKQGREEYAKTKILSNTHNGAVILLHANSKDNANILDEDKKGVRINYPEIAKENSKISIYKINSAIEEANLTVQDKIAQKKKSMDKPN